MMIEKIFHVHQDLEATRGELSNFHGLRRVLQNVNATRPGSNGTAQLEFVTGNGFHGEVELELLPANDSNQTLFRSTGGNIEVAGLIEFIPIRDNLTEVQLTVEYAIASPMHSVLDAVTASVDRFVTRQLRRIQVHLDGHEHEPAERRFRGETAFVQRPQLAH